MSSTFQPRTKDHWSVRLHLKRPTTTNRVVLATLAAIQSLLLILTASSIATGGSLYGCSAACGTPAQPATPAIAVLLGMLMLVLPAVIGFLSQTWQLAITGGAALPWLVAVLISANTLLAPTASVVPGATISQRGHPATTLPPTSHFGLPFWLDTGHVWTLLVALVFFATLAWMGWVAGQAMKEQ